MAIATLRLSLLGRAHDGFRDAGFLLLRPPVLRPGLSAQGDFFGGGVGDAEIRPRPVEAGQTCAALREVRAEGDDLTFELGVFEEEVDGWHGAEG